jgi:hypothetical protein
VRAFSSTVLVGPTRKRGPDCRSAQPAAFLREVAGAEPDSRSLLGHLVEKSLHQLCYSQPFCLLFALSPGRSDEEQKKNSQICELFLKGAVEDYKNDGPQFIQRLLAGHKHKKKVI